MVSFLTVAFIASSGFAGDINAKLFVPKKIYTPGDRIQFNIAYTNVSNRTIRFIPQSVVYPTDLFAVTDADRRALIKPKHYGFLSVDFEEQARNIKTLKPRGTCKSVITADVATHLPDYFHDTSHGLFVVFRGSAFRLPREGVYVFTVVYRATKDEPVRFYAQGEPRVWVGEAHSNPVGITFRY